MDDIAHPIAEIVAKMAAMEKIPHEHRTHDWFHVQEHLVNMVRAWAEAELVYLHHTVEITAERAYRGDR